MLLLDSIDNFLNRITMYRLVFYSLAALLGVGAVLGALGALPLSPLSLVFSTAILLIFCIIANELFARVFKVPANAESVYITALILALIITPPPVADVAGLAFLGWAAAWAMASKYIFAIGKKHIFNPAAFAVALTAFTINQSASWWVGTPYMLPFTAVAAFLVVRKIRRFDMVFAFFAAVMGTITVRTIASSGSLSGIGSAILYSPMFFFAGIMLTEPLTTPPSRNKRIAYGALIGALFAPFVHIGPVFSTPELALLIGNIFSYMASPKGRHILKFKERIKIGEGIYDFVFVPDRPLSFRPGQYLEWTLGHAKPDSRGNRRYFTIASSPTENEIRMGVKFTPNPSSFKQQLLALKPGDEIVASQLAGDFVLTGDKDQKMVFIAGGIGVTPFRSMVKYMLDRGEKRHAALLYSVKTEGELAYRKLFDEASDHIGLKTVYALTEKDRAPADWQGHKGFIDVDLVKKEIPDYDERVFYLSGPRSMVVAFEQMLGSLGIKRSRIKTDYFPGFA
jgi:glycine betaine catabolism B